MHFQTFFFTLLNTEDLINLLHVWLTELLFAKSTSKFQINFNVLIYNFIHFPLSYVHKIFNNIHVTS